MVRPVSFDREKVLTESMRLFWQHGYCKTSMQVLGKQMQMHPGSLYGAFKNKQGLFSEALELYFQRASAMFAERLAGGDTPLAGIRNFFDCLVDDIATAHHVHGCLMINTATELAETGEHESLLQRLDEMFASHQSQFCQALEQAQQAGEITADKDPASLARYLLVGVRGLRVYGQLRPRREELQQVVDHLLSTLVS